MGFINAIIGLVSDPRAAIAGRIAALPLTAFGLIFLVIFIETGVVFMPFLHGDSLLFASGVFAATDDLPIHILLPVVWAEAILGDQSNFVKYTRLKSCAPFGGRHNRLEPNVTLACTNEHMLQTSARNSLTTTTEPPLSHKQRGRYVMPNAPNPEGSRNTPN